MTHIILLALLFVPVALIFVALWNLETPQSQPVRIQAGRRSVTSVRGGKAFR